MSTTVRGYETLALLGSGQYGDVYLVRRERDGQLFAAKISRTGNAQSRSDEQRQRSLAIQEAALLARLRHANITQCIETIENGDSGELAIVMEYASGGDLDAYIQSHHERCVLQCFVSISRAHTELTTSLIESLSYIRTLSSPRSPCFRQ